MLLENRFTGCMLGLAIGDALGYPVEFMNRDEITQAYGPQGIIDFVENQWHPRGMYSDDTQMTIAVAQALLAADIDDLDSIMRNIKREFIAWANSPENNRAPGQTCMDGCRQLQRGRHWFSSGDPYSKGCGAAMRSAPIGLLFFRNSPRLVEVARAVAICTHAHPTALASSIAAAAAVAYLLGEHPAAGIVPQLLTLLNQDRGAPGYLERVSHDPVQEQTRLLTRIETVLPVEPEQAFDQIGGGWVGEETVAGALYCFLRTPNDFCTTVLTAANACKSDTRSKGKGRCDSDSIACIAGGLSGAYNGIQAIPREWVEAVEQRDLLMNMGQRLATRATASGA
jgi:ADP-ribosylglycohydrolase